MKNIVKTMILAITISVGLIASSCNVSVSGESKEEKRAVKNFTGVDLAVPADLYITQGESYSFTIEGDSEFLEKIQTEVQGETLKIKTEGWFNFGWNNLKVKIKITMPTVERLSVAGSGDIKAVTPIISEDLVINISGSGDISITELKVKTLSANVSGSGDISLIGNESAQNASVKVTGSGDVSLKGILFDDAEVSISGSGDVYLEAKENLNAKVVGSGDIVYSGNPLIDAKVSGSGRIRNK
jgi:hypothetical protein